MNMDHARGAGEHFSDVLVSWCLAVEGSLVQEPAQDSDAGPRSEFEYWRARQATFNGLTGGITGEKERKSRPQSGSGECIETPVE